MKKYGQKKKETETENLFACLHHRFPKTKKKKKSTHILCILRKTHQESARAFCDSVAPLSFALFVPRHESLVAITSSPFISTSRSRISLLGASHGSTLRHVVLLGWLGAQTRHLSKYDEYHRQHGCITTSRIPPALSNLFPSQAAEFAEDVIEEILEERVLHGFHGPTYIHSFSGNGLHCFAHILRHIRQGAHINKEVAELLSSIRGVVVDSAPPLPSVERWTRGFVGAVNSSLPWLSFGRASEFARSPSDRVCDPYTHPVLTPLSRWFFKAFFSWTGYREYIDGIRFSLVHGEPRVPYHIIYSKSDELVPWQEVEHFVEELSRELGSHMVETKIFSDSEHVMHFRSYPDAYMEEVYSFFDRCQKGDFNHRS